MVMGKFSEMYIHLALANTDKKKYRIRHKVIKMMIGKVNSGPLLQITKAV